MNRSDFSNLTELPDLSESQYLNLLDRLSDAVSVVAGRRIVYMNQAYLNMLGFTAAEQIIGREIGELVAPEDRELVMTRGWQRQLGEDPPDFYEFTMHAPNGVHVAQVRSIPVLYAGETAVLSFVRDVTERREMEQQLKLALSLQSATLEATTDGISTVDFHGNVLNYNRRFLDIWDLDESFPDRRAQDRGGFMQEIAGKLKNPEAYLRDVNTVYDDPDQESFAMLEFLDGRIFERYTSPLKVGGETVGVVWSYRDITQRKQLEELLQHNATHDPLTDLLNRRGFEEHLLQQIRESDEMQTSALLLMDLDQFKDINDSLGHPAGDEVLVGLAGLLRSIAPPSATIARLGGDEFGIILPNVTVEQMEDLGYALFAALSQHVFETSAGDRVRITASAGVVLYPLHGGSVEQLLSRVDLALYEAKEKGRNRFSIYSPTERRAKKSENRLQMRSAIREALDSGRMELYAQPVIDLLSNQVSQYELLLRLPLDSGRVLRAAQFIGTAEGSGLILAIDNWVITRAIQLLRESEEREERFSLAVNLSGAGLDDTELLQSIQRQLQRGDIDASRLIFEVTETAAVSNVAGARLFIRNLKELGCRFALDDFGVGFSSLFQLKHLPVDFLKIDGSFIRDIQSNYVDQEVVRTMVSIADALGMETTAEAVRSAEDAALLRQFGVRYGQGYFLGRPRPIDGFLNDRQRSVA